MTSNAKPNFASSSSFHWIVIAEVRVTTHEIDPAAQQQFAHARARPRRSCPAPTSSAIRISTRGSRNALRSGRSWSQSSRMPARNGACNKSRSAAVAESHRIDAKMGGENLGPVWRRRDRFRHAPVIETHLGLISTSQRTSSRSPWASSEMHDRAMASRLDPLGSAASISQRRPRSSTKSPTLGMGYRTKADNEAFAGNVELGARYAGLSRSSLPFSAATIGSPAGRLIARARPRIRPPRGHEQAYWALIVHLLMPMQPITILGRSTQPRMSIERPSIPRSIL